MADSVVQIKRALVSVSDKRGIVDFCRKLSKAGVEILSTGGTAKALTAEKIPVISIDSYTGFPEIMDGRVKTLHPKVHGGLLAIRDNPSHIKQMTDNGISPIDMVVVNLYPFKQTIAKPNVTIEEAVENIDIGGPTMIRSAAKNHHYVTVIVDPADYGPIADEISKNGGVSLDTRKRLMVKAYKQTADYDSMIDAYFSKQYLNENILRLSYREGVTLRYGENPHQSAAFYKNPETTEISIATAKQLHGKELSYNNIVDADAALEAAKENFGITAAVIIKHTNPCGYATGKTLKDALSQAWKGDPVSAYGSVIAVTRPVDLDAAKVLQGRFVEILIAPSYAPDALKYLKEKSKDLRILELGSITSVNKEEFVLKHVTGGILRQGRDLLLHEEWKLVTKAQFPGTKDPLAKFAWTVCKHVKSNAIVLCAEYAPGFFMVMGMGAGQPNRVDSLRKLAITKTRENLIIELKEAGKPESEEFFKQRMSEMVLASDAFFPFPDNIEEAHEAGIQYIVEPGGSKRDADVIAACDTYGIAMIFTNTRHFRH